MEAADAAADPATLARLTSLASSLRSVASLYGQHAPAVAAAASAALAPHAAALDDFVRLAKWEDRGYYANRAAADKAARALHRLTRRARGALAAPAGGVLTRSGGAMGLPDLEPGALAAAATLTFDTASKPLPAPEPAPQAAGAARLAWSTIAAAAAALAEGATARGCLPRGAPRAASVTRYVHRLDSVLGRRVADVAADPTAGAPAALAALATTAASARDGAQDRRLP